MLLSVNRIGKLNLVDLAGSENIGEWASRLEIGASIRKDPVKSIGVES